jgi:hypothetical protein
MRNWIALVLAACVACTAHYPDSPTPAPTVAGVRIHYTSPHTSITALSSASLTLYAINSEGIYEVATNLATWFSSNASVATVTNGFVRAVANGTTDIVATYRGYTSTARIIVGPPNGGRFPALVVSFSPPETGRTTRVLTSFMQLSGPGRDVNAEATWSSSDPRVFTVDRGELTSHGPGTASITASFGGATTTVYASVAPLRALP